jgi:hypothetical protein
MTTVTNAHDVVVRDIRFRRGSADDSFQFAGVSNAIADHISAEWTSDNLVSVLNSSNVTVQWSVMANSLYGTNFTATNPPTGALLRQGSGAVTFHHNLFADNYTGSPRLGDNLTLDFVNNVIYNWGLFSGLSDGTSDQSDFSPNGATNELNYACNYLIAGPDTAAYATNYAITNIAFFGGTTNSKFATWIFQTNNFMDSDNNGVLNGSDTGWAMFTNDYTPFSHPFATLPVSVDEAYQAYEKVLDFAGVNMALRDSVDTNIVTGVRNQAGTFISASPLSSMVGWWKGESNALDSAGANNGTMMNNAGFAPGKVGTAFNIPPFSSASIAYSRPSNGPFVQVPYTNWWAFGSNNFTIELWANFTNLLNGDTGNPFSGLMIACDEASGDEKKWLFAWAGTPAGGVLEFHINGPTINGGAGVFLVQAPFLPVVNQWYHLAVTRNGDLYTIYENGVAVGSQTDSNVIPDPGVPLTIGEAEGFYFSGRLDEVTVYKRALSAGEIATIYNDDSAGKIQSTYAIVPSGLPYLDTDQDGIPDFWE